MKESKRYLVSGLVQGVFYRASTEAKARELGITGWVKNNANGDVEVFATGTPQQLSDLETWLWQGPRLAQVKLVQVLPEDHQNFEQFSVRS